MNATETLIADFVGQNLTIDIDGETTNLCVISWQAIVQESEAVFAKTIGMTAEEKDAFWNNAPVGALGEIYAYFIGEEDFEQKVDDNEWIPFGLLGLMHGAHNYGFGEMNNDGLLVFDVSDGKADAPEIILLVDGEEKKIAENFNELLIEQVD